MDAVEVNISFENELDAGLGEARLLRGPKVALGFLVTPTIWKGRLLNRMTSPMGFCPLGKSSCTVLSSSTATARASLMSASVRSRPRASSSPLTLKYCSPTPLSEPLAVRFLYTKVPLVLAEGVALAM